jgi:DNA-binding transcriptional LysR family regulator
MPDFRLQVFIKVAQRLNLTQAAQELGISQPAVSKHIQELEIQYGTQLLNRTGNKIALSPAGKIFVIHAEAILDKYGALEAEMYRISNNYCGEIRISADNPAIDENLFLFFLDFCKQHPCIKISFVETPDGSSKEHLEEMKIDLAFTNGPYSAEGIDYSPFAKQKWVFIAHSDGIFANQSKVSIDEIIEYKLSINAFKSKIELDYNILFESNLLMTYFSDIDTIKYLMYKNDSVSLLPLYSVKNELRDGSLKVIDVDGVTFEEEVGILSRKDESNHSVQWFLEFVKEHNR